MKELLVNIFPGLCLFDDRKDKDEDAKKEGNRRSVRKTVLVKGEALLPSFRSSVLTMYPGKV